MMILSTSISVSAGRSTADRVFPCQRWVGQLRHGRLAGQTLVLTVQLIMSRVQLRAAARYVGRSTSPRSFILSASFFCSCSCAISLVILPINCEDHHLAWVLLFNCRTLCRQLDVLFPAPSLDLVGQVPCLGLQCA